MNNKLSQMYQKYLNNNIVFLFFSWKKRILIDFNSINIFYFFY